MIFKKPGQKPIKNLYYFRVFKWQITSKPAEQFDKKLRTRG